MNAEQQERALELATRLPTHRRRLGPELQEEVFAVALFACCMAADNGLNDEESDALVAHFIRRTLRANRSQLGIKRGDADSASLRIYHDVRRNGLGV